MARTRPTLSRLARTLALGVLGGVIALGTSPEAEAQRRTVRVGDHQVSQRHVTRDLGTSFQRSRRDRFVPRDYRRAGRYETRTERVWVPGHTERIWVPARYEWRYDSCGRQFRVLVQAGHFRTVCHPGRFERRTTRVWVPHRPICEPVQRRGRVTRVGRRWR